ncbi:MAG TPA: transcriptional repressor [Candidatus Dormibacteraeota bacterium]|jgi:Fe2+ or Zn2+ uptake regulation protein|nr:transcriptional repressor [Candidatus Dormibacteraeota bacterium]
MPRPSHVRDAVQGQLRGSNRHVWTVEEMLAELRAAGVAADFSSVFRSLVWCEEQGSVKRVDVGDGRARFEPAGDHHEHARCERCGTVAEVPGCVLADIPERVGSLTGFAINAHRLVFIGLCPDCQ